MKKLKELRIKKKYTVKKMSELLNISEPYYSQIENKKRRLNYEMAKKIATVLNKKPDDIFYDEFV